MRILGGLLAVWVAEMVLVNFVLGDPSAFYQAITWTPALDLTLLYQPITRLFVQGPNLFGVLLDLLVLYFFLPWVVDRFPRKQLITGAAAVLLGCIAAGLIWLGISHLGQLAGLPASARWFAGSALGWHPYVIALVALFGLALPDATINLFFVLPIKARWIFYMTIGFAVLGFIAQPGIASFERFGAIGGIVAWFFLFGPGALRRRFRRAGQSIEKDLRFKVYNGGRSGSSRGRKPPDETLH